MPTKVEVKCSCGAKFMARVADRNRGWGKSCSKSCKAIAQEKRTGQYAKLQQAIGGNEDVSYRGSFRVR